MEHHHVPSFQLGFRDTVVPITLIAHPTTSAPRGLGLWPGPKTLHAGEEGGDLFLGLGDAVQDRSLQVGMARQTWPNVYASTIYTQRRTRRMSPMNTHVRGHQDTASTYRRHCSSHFPFPHQR